MTQEHPITPPPELVQRWRATPEYTDLSEKIFVVSLTTKKLLDIATQAARWGADQELEACCKWLPKLPPWSADDLRRHRRPKPPSLAEQATAELDDAVMRGDCITTTDAMPLLRAAIKRLAELDTNAHYSP